MKVTIKLKDKETGVISEPVPIEDIIFNQNEVEFIFPDEELGNSQLPYKDFLFFQNNYEVIVKIGE